MLQISPQVKIYLCQRPVDFRKGIDGLAGLCRNYLNHQPMDGGLFIFINRRKTAIKTLFYDGQGFWLCCKRLSVGRFRFFPKGDHWHPISLTQAQLQVLLFNGDPFSIREAVPFRKIA